MAGMNKIIIFSLILIGFYVGIFLIPNHVDKFALIPEKSSEIWRFGTYSFTHLDLAHLIENIIGLGLVVFIAFELKVMFNDFSSTYLSSGILSVIPFWLIVPFTALGASNAVLGGFGSLFEETKKYNINNLVIFAPLSLVIFLKAGLNLFTYGFGPEFSFAFKQGLAHFSGLLFGIGFIFLLGKAKPYLTKRKRYVLRGVLG
jgi:membrane associated rhomboid family serine protease